LLAEDRPLELGQKLAKRWKISRPPEVSVMGADAGETGGYGISGRYRRRSVHAEAQ
jgi:hypothetical protein